MAKSKKTETPTPKCPISREQFHGKAPVLEVMVGERDTVVAKFLGAPKDFSTGSFGWGVNEKLTVTVDGKPVRVQASINLTVIGSKES